jgi:hypothetical protein
MKKEDCKTCLMVYYGIHPFERHMSRSSGSFLVWVKQKYGLDLVYECIEELKIEYRIEET